ncbi:hypothetical protein FSARC_761 [Fusarium sarcochroum]|uniref:F-box domain-containing protein n=1 Tax=Fusarium sarcochroum TaxID=1208366 RepID=A0A8H4XG00_9HYPO|nr:hypothetical protein FSARC_761 [Fusarium sarcochroum]
MAALDLMPCEILLDIIRDSSPQELCRLSYTCKRLEGIAGSCLWKNIELHEEGYHESSAELNDPPPFRPPRRFYHSSKRKGWHSDIGERAEKLFTVLQTLRTNDEKRLRELTGRVKNLCTVIEQNWRPDENEVTNPVSAWNLLPYFTNLEILELHGSSDISAWKGMSGTAIQAPPLTKLRFAKLFAYIPRSVATYVLRSGTMLERLELGILDLPVPSKIGIGGGEDLNYGNPIVNGGGVIPRPLGDFYPHGSVSFPKLRHLYLCQPCNSCEDYFGQHNIWSICAEQAALETWRRILLSSGQTLETLVLEQRPGAGVEENEGFSEEEFLNTGASGAGNRALVEKLGDMFLEKATFPRLKQMYLYGFIARPYLRGRPSGATPAGWLMHGLEAQGIACEARRGKWCLFDQESGAASWAKWSGEGNWNIHDGYMGIRWYSLLARV